MYSDSSFFLIQVNVQWSEMIDYDRFSFHISAFVCVGQDQVSILIRELYLLSLE